MTTKFTSLTVLLPVINETASLLKTVEILERNCRRHIVEIIIVTSTMKTTTEAWAAIAKARVRSMIPITIVRQKLPFLGGALRDAIDAVTAGSHVLMMASDLETDPEDALTLITEAKMSPEAIIATTRWVGGHWRGYSRVKYACNWMFQWFFSWLYGTELTDMTFGYRLYPVEVLRQIKWEELRHPFLFESLVKPLRLGVQVFEVPTNWVARVEGESQNPFFRNFEYFWTGFKSRLMPKSKIIKAKP